MPSAGAHARCGAGEGPGCWRSASHRLRCAAAAAVARVRGPRRRRRSLWRQRRARRAAIGLGARPATARWLVAPRRFFFFFRSPFSWRRPSKSLTGARAAERQTALSLAYGTPVIGRVAGRRGAASRGLKFFFSGVCGGACVPVANVAYVCQLRPAVCNFASLEAERALVRTVGLAFFGICVGRDVLAERGEANLGPRARRSFVR